MKHQKNPGHILRVGENPLKSWLSVRDYLLFWSSSQSHHRRAHQNFQYNHEDHLKGQNLDNPLHKPHIQLMLAFSQFLQTNKVERLSST